MELFESKPWSKHFSNNVNKRPNKEQKHSKYIVVRSETKKKIPEIQFHNHSHFKSMQHNCLFCLFISLLCFNVFVHNPEMLFYLHDSANGNFLWFVYVMLFSLIMFSFNVIFFSFASSLYSTTFLLIAFGASSSHLCLYRGW